MSTRTRPAILLLLITAATAFGVAGCGGTEQSQADKSAELAAEQEKNPPKIEDPKAVTVKAVKVTPGPGEGDIDKKPVIPKQTGADPKVLVVQDLIVGTGKEAKDGDTVDVRYVGVLRKDGKEFDSSWKRADNNFSFTLGGGQVIQGWDQGVVGMKVGGRRRLIIPGELAYGAAGSPPSIPANATLVFVVDLKKVTSAKQ
ncbi:MAG TPA: FKBP-type peptidyl-prolyl cis-trans isomerase [Solirubrobacteraceae bacterium]|nr:FKBP-type peptidyl-prolyl cis-trans isomerase [Solirubrobacteraceae bacterium]